MATKITLTLVETLDAEGIEAVSGLLMDALYEYRGVRLGDYVERRYADQSEAFRARKKVRVARAITIAMALHQSASQVQVETFVGPCPKCKAPGMADAFYDAHPDDDPRRCDECGML